MAQLDKLLTHAAARGARALRLEPNQPPSLELQSGQSTPLLATALLPSMIEALSQEVLPDSMKEEWSLGREATFGHECAGRGFRLTLQRGPVGPRILAELLGATPPQELEPVYERTLVTGAPATPPPAPRPVEMARPEPSVPAVTIQGQLPRASAAQGSDGRFQAEQLFAELLRVKGSDLHLRSFEVPLFRVNGELEEMEGHAPLGSKQMLEMMEALAPPMAWNRFQDTHDADFAYAYEAGGCRLRVNFFMDRQGPGLVCRVIPNQIPDPDQLGLPDPVRRLADLSKGLVLVTGPTGSGKSTTLAAIIDLANRKRSDHILTIEDPIEFVHPRKQCLITQREVGTHTEAFKTGLRAALREDPDIVLVGEMRDLETIAIAVETAVTGHLVFGTLHTSSAIGTVDRIVDQFPADRQQQIRVMLADALKAVVSQTLLKKVGGGRVAALETLFITPAISNLIREGKNFQIASAMQTGRAYGQRLMNDALVELLQAGTVTPMECYMKCPDKESFMASLKRANIAWDPRGDEKPMPL